MEGKEFITLTKEIISEPKNIPKVIDAVIDPFKDYIDAASDIATPIKVMRSAFNLASKLKLKGFLENYAKQFENNINDLDEQKLIDYFKSEKNIEYVAEIVDSARNSRSLLCSSLLGVLAGRCIANKQNITYEDAIIVYALRNMLDVDLYNFLLIFNSVKFQKNVTTTPQLYFEGVGTFSGKEQLHITIQKLGSLQIILQESQSYANPISTRLYELVEKSKVVPEEHIKEIITIMSVFWSVNKVKEISEKYRKTD